MENLRNNQKSFYCDSNASYWNDPSLHGCSYASVMGFFDALGLSDIGEKLNTYSGSETYFPLSRVDYEALSRHHADFHDGISEYSGKLAAVLTSNLPEARGTLDYLIREIMRNTFEHTCANHIWIAAQRHDQEGKIEVAIADNGEGIRQVISVNSSVKNQISTDASALQLAIRAEYQVTLHNKNINQTFWEILDTACM
ncbi:hypothetical protein R5R49_08760 [Oenococcus oeni]